MVAKVDPSGGNLQTSSLSLALTAVLWLLPVSQSGFGHELSLARSQGKGLKGLQMDCGVKREGVRVSLHAKAGTGCF